MNEAIKKFLEEGGKIQQLEYGVKSDTNVCMNCKGYFPVQELTKGVKRKCKTCVEKKTKFRTRR